MTKRATTTQAQVRRLIMAALESGLHVTGIFAKPDGTVVVATVPLAPDQRSELPVEYDGDVVL